MGEGTGVFKQSISKGAEMNRKQKAMEERYLTNIQTHRKKPDFDAGIKGRMESFIEKLMQINELPQIYGTSFEAPDDLGQAYMEVRDTVDRNNINYYLLLEKEMLKELGRRSTPLYKALM